MSKSITVKGTEIKIIEVQKMDYISLTDMVRSFGDDTLIYSWMRNRNTLEFIGIWEQLNNPEFKGNEFVTFKMQAGLNRHISRIMIQRKIQRQSPKAYCCIPR